MKKNLLTKMKKAVAMVMAACLLFGWMGHGASDAGVAPCFEVEITDKICSQYSIWILYSSDIPCIKAYEF